MGLLHLEELLLALFLRLDTLLSLVDLPFADLGNHAHGVRDVDLVVADEDRRGFSHVVDLRQLDQHGHVVVEGPVVRVVVPRHDRQAALRLQHVGSGRVVDDHGVLHVAPQLAHVLDEHAIDEGAVFAEESRRAVPVRVHHVHQRVSVLQERGRARGEHSRRGGAGRLTLLREAV